VIIITKIKSSKSTKLKLIQNEKSKK